jgi:hypothetical protein
MANGMIILITLLKKIIFQGYKTETYAKYYYNDMLCCNKKGGYDVTLHKYQYVHWSTTDCLIWSIVIISI